MKQWNGLLKKECSLMREWIYGSLITTFVLIVATTIVLALSAGNSMEPLFIVGILIVFYMFIGFFLPVVFLLNSLWKEWKRSDIWLHSTGSAYKLFGAKAVSAAGIGAVNLFVPAILLLIYVWVFGSPSVELTQGDFFTYTVPILSSFYTASLTVLSVGLFLAVFNQLIKPVVKGLAIPITLALLALASWIYQLVEEFPFYQKIVSFGPIGYLSKDAFHIERDGFSMSSTEPVIYMGDVFVSILFIAIMFVISSALFEKKVRL